MGWWRTGTASGRWRTNLGGRCEHEVSEQGEKAGTAVSEQVVWDVQRNMAEFLGWVGGLGSEWIKVCTGSNCFLSRMGDMKLQESGLKSEKTIQLKGGWWSDIGKVVQNGRMDPAECFGKGIQYFCAAFTSKGEVDCKRSHSKECQRTPRILGRTLKVPVLANLQ